MKISREYLDDVARQAAESEELPLTGGIRRKTMTRLEEIRTGLWRNIDYDDIRCFLDLIERQEEALKAADEMADDWDTRPCVTTPYWEARAKTTESGR